jgi:hypothetical protein
LTPKGNGLIHAVFIHEKDISLHLTLRRMRRRTMFW